jgi:hypothetical protein
VETETAVIDLAVDFVACRHEIALGTAAVRRTVV